MSSSSRETMRPPEKNPSREPSPETAETWSPHEVTTSSSKVVARSKAKAPDWPSSMGTIVLPSQHAGQASSQHKFAVPSWPASMYPSQRTSARPSQAASRFPSKGGRDAASTPPSRYLSLGALGLPSQAREQPVSLYPYEFSTRILSPYPPYGRTEPWKIYTENTFNDEKVNYSRENPSPMEPANSNPSHIMPAHPLMQLPHKKWKFDDSTRVIPDPVCSHCGRFFCIKETCPGRRS